jgi:DHA1 family bicyclomycin/chloramphenicol resistance-like MFS transporter
VISAYLLGLAAAQPVSGYLCDRFGRRPVMLSGFTLFVAASIACAVTTSLNQLILLRFLQAVGVSVGTVASRAIVRDTRDVNQAAEAISYIVAAMGVAPIIAPMIGGWLSAVAGHQGIFLMTAVIGAFVLVGMHNKLPETLDTDREPPKWRDWLDNYKYLLRSGPFLGYTLIFGFIQGSFFAFRAVGASLFASSFDMQAKTFGLVWGAMAISYVGGATAAGRITRIIGTDRVLKYGIWMTLFAGWFLFAIIFTTGVSIAGVLVPMFLLMAVAGAVAPAAMAGAVNHSPAIAGTSSGLSSALGIGVGGLFTIISGVIYTGDFTTIALLMAVSTTLATASWLLVQSEEGNGR